MAAYLGYRVIERLSQLLPVAAGYGTARFATRVWWRFRPAVRRHVCENLALLLGGSAGEYSQASQEVFCHFGYYLFELFTMHRLEKESVAVEGLEYLEAARRANRGVIVLTAHLGNWELGAKWLKSMGYPVSAVALRHKDERMDALFNEQRRRAEVDVIPLDGHATRASLQALAQGRMLGLLADRDFTGDGISVPVGQGKLMIPRGPAVLSIRAQAPIVPTFLIREGTWRFRLICKQVLWPTMEMSTRQSVEALVGRYAGVLEDALKRYAQQWLMFQPIFQTG